MIKVRFFYKDNRLKMSSVLLLLIVTYSLLAFRRIKNLFMPKINGVSISNEVFIVPLVLFVLCIIGRQYFKYRDRILLLSFVSLLGVSIVNSVKMQDWNQYFYAALLLFLPMLFLFLINPEDVRNFEKIFNIIIFYCFIYSLLFIVASLFPEFFQRFILGEKSMPYYGQYRATLMLGSSITVSYFFNITLPIIFYKYYQCMEKKRKIYYLICILLNVAATFIGLSRLASMTSVFIFFAYLFFISGKRAQFSKKTILIIAGCIVLFYLLSQYDFSRLTGGFEDTSTFARLESMNLGIHIFENNPFLGSSLGRYFQRIYSNVNITAYGYSGLVDPHNTWILSLSELGLVGTFCLVLLFFRIHKVFGYIQNNCLRKTAKMVLYAFLLGSIGGSQMINEISFAIILWIYLGFFFAIAKRDYYLEQRK